MYGVLFPKDYGTSMDVQRCANTLKQLFSFRKELKTAMLTKSMPFNHVLSCLAKFNDLCTLITAAFYDFPWAFLLDRALCAITFSVLDIGVIYLWPWV